MAMALAPVLAVVLALGAAAGFPDTYPEELRAPPGYLLREPGLRELAPAELAERPGAFPFPLGERLVYQVRYFGVEVGPATIEVARPRLIKAPAARHWAVAGLAHSIPRAATSSRRRLGDS